MLPGQNLLPECGGEPAVKSVDPAAGEKKNCRQNRPEKPDSLAPEPIQQKERALLRRGNRSGCCAVTKKAFERLEQRVMSDEERGITNEVLEAYARSLRNLRDKFHTKLQLAHESVFEATHPY